jgi:Ser/Thr protein kinase RdoA (MazF antagonist)
VELDHSIVEAAAAATGTRVEVLGATARGESGSTFDVRVDGEAAILKVLPAGSEARSSQARLVRLLDTLRGRGSPVPEHLGAGATDDYVFTLQRRLPGELLEPRRGEAVEPRLLDLVLPALLDAVELQADAGDLADPPWPGWVLDTVTDGGDGYCLHSTMRERPDTSSILDRAIAIARRARDHGRDPVRTTDIVHFDLNPANVLHERGRLTGIVDWNVPFEGAMQGDRGFDVATLLFYTYDNPATRRPLWEHASAISGATWTAVYLAHLALRQVEWSRRHHPESAADERFRRIARDVLADCERLVS